MKFCSECAHPVSLKVPEGDNLPRSVCDHCGTIHYVNPRIIAGCLPVYQQQVLLCKRAIEPRAGYWTLPAGFMENGETLEAGAVRETLEESGVVVQAGPLLSTISVPHISQVHVFFLAEMRSADHAVSTSESTEVQLFAFDDIPWDAIAFPTVRKTLEYYLQDIEQGQPKNRVFDIDLSDRLTLRT